MINFDYTRVDYLGLGWTVGGYLLPAWLRPSPQTQLTYQKKSADETEIICKLLEFKAIKRGLIQLN